MQIIKQTTKTLIVRDNNRSSDAIAPNFIYGCLGGCMKSYCYVARHNSNQVRINLNTTDILTSISNWVINKPFPKIPNQVDTTYYCIDIGCSTDVPLLSKHYNWQRVFTYFNEHPKLKSTFATKYPSRFDIFSYDIDVKKHRIRISMMPQKYADVLEPNTDSIETRIKMLQQLQGKIEVHLNFSPVIWTDGWLTEYDKLFRLIYETGIEFRSEVIFLTYSNIQFNKNSKEVNKLCWNPNIQEIKNSEHDKNNVRYKWYLKEHAIERFVELYSKYFDPKTIRYIF